MKRVICILVLGLNVFSAARADKLIPLEYEFEALQQKFVMRTLTRYSEDGKILDSSPVVVTPVVHDASVVPIAGVISDDLGVVQLSCCVDEMLVISNSVVILSLASGEPAIILGRIPADYPLAPKDFVPYITERLKSVSCLIESPRAVETSEAKEASGDTEKATGSGL